ncbi:MAG: hypothetical protein LBE34_05325 [Flavobacteriaceae bacterium]|jgi:hypothetical protein|nr:hypothetical protein [Flavobacteriaceae bacterium]
MKKYLSYITLFVCSSLVLISCSSSDDSSEEVIVEKNNVTFTFDHKMFGQELKYGTMYKENSNNEKLNIDFIKYILSNFQLTTDKGKVFTYPKDKTYFFIDSETKDYKVVLQEVPAGNYTKVKFGVGVDQEKYLRGETDQQEFWDLCKKHDLTWGWLVGYKFINYQGKFINGGDAEKGFQLHIGSHGSKLDNYREVVLDSKEPIKVSKAVAATIVVDVEVSKILDSTNKIVLKDKPVIMVDPENAPKIVDNAKGMFSIKSVNASK